MSSCIGSHPNEGFGRTGYGQEEGVMSLPSALIGG